MYAENRKRTRVSCDENVFLKAVRTLSKFNLIFHYKLKTNLVIYKENVIYTYNNFFLPNCHDYFFILLLTICSTFFMENKVK